MSWPDEHAAQAFCYLTTRGRRSGRSHRIEIWFAVHQGILYMMAGGREEADWVRNLVAEPLVTVQIAGDVRTGIARLVVPDTDEDARARRMLVEKYRAAEDDLQSWGRAALPVAVEDWRPA